MSDFRYISNARTLDELRQEMLSDIRRRLSRLDDQIAFEKRNTEKLKLEAVKREFEDLARFWQEVELKDRRKRVSKPEIQ